MYALENKPNVDPPDSDYPWGNIKDNDGTGNGTPVNKLVYGDFHQFFSKLMDAAGITPNDLPDNEYSGNQLYEALIHITGGLRTKVFEIGDWDMDADANASVTLTGVLAEKVRRIDVIVRSDIDAFAGPTTKHYKLDSFSAGGAMLGGASLIGSEGFIGVVTLTRLDAGFFDATEFDSTSYNRGWVTVSYEE